MDIADRALRGCTVAFLGRTVAAVRRVAALVARPVATVDVQASLGASASPP
jgi:hypothetical protein